MLLFMNIGIWVEQNGLKVTGKKPSSCLYRVQNVTVGHFDMLYLSRKMPRNFIRKCER